MLEFQFNTKSHKLQEKFDKKSSLKTDIINQNKIELFMCLNQSYINRLLFFIPFLHFKQTCFLECKLNQG